MDVVEALRGAGDDDHPKGLFHDDSRVFFEFQQRSASVIEDIVAASDDFDRMVIGTGIDRNLLGRQVVSRIT